MIVVTSHSGSIPLAQIDPHGKSFLAVALKKRARR